jgi:hypothetical protein
MPNELLAAVDALSVLLVDFDPSLLSGAECVTVVETLAAIEKRCAAARIRAAARAADCRAPAAKGFPDPVEWLARQSGTTTGEARNALKTASLLDDCPQTRDALVAGELSVGQAGEIVRTEAECPGSEEKLLSLARTTGMTGLREAARKTRLEAQDVTELHRRQRAARYLRFWQDDQGMIRINGAFTPEDGVALTNRIDVLTDRLWRAANHGGQPEPRERLAADALIKLTGSDTCTSNARETDSTASTTTGNGTTDNGTTRSSTTGNGSPGRSTTGSSTTGSTTRSSTTGNRTTDDGTTGSSTTGNDSPGNGTTDNGTTAGGGTSDGTAESDGGSIDECSRGGIVRDRGPDKGVSHSPGRRADLVIVCDLGAFRRGHTHPGEVCHIIGGGPVPVDLARQMAEGDAFLKAVLHDGIRIETVAHFGRYKPARLLTALSLGDPPDFDGVVCVHPGCDRRHHLEWDHVDPVANGGPTSYQNLSPRCRPHHDEKTEQDRAAGLLHGGLPKQ